MGLQLLAMPVSAIRAPLPGSRRDVAIAGRHAHTIGADPFGPRFEALGGSRASAVQVERDEAQHVLA